MESVCAVKRTEGSNPSLSAIIFRGFQKSRISRYPLGTHRVAIISSLVIHLFSGNDLFNTLSNSIVHVSFYGLYCRSSSSKAISRKTL